jgi:hypothetical protein
MTDKSGQIISRDGVALDPELPTIWMVRRMVEYKSQLPILKDIIHVVCANSKEEVETLWGKMNGLQMQVVVGGLAPEGSEQAQYDEAERLLLEAVEGRLLKLGDQYPHTIESLNNLITLYEAWNKPEKAEEWRAKQPQTKAVNE